MSDQNESQLNDLLASLDPNNRLLASEVILGTDATEFVSSPIGKYMVGCAQHEYTEALIELSRVSWWNRNKIRALQAKAWRAKSFLEWLQELIVRGEKAARLLDGEDDG